MLDAVVGISQSQLLPSPDSQQRQGGSRRGGWARVAVFHLLVKDFSLRKALEEEEEGRKLYVKPISVACQELQPIQAPELCERGSCLPRAAPLRKKGLPCLGHKAGLDQGLSVSCCCPACLLLH